MKSPLRRVLKFLLALVLLIVIAPALTGFMKIDWQLDIKSPEEASGTITVMISKKFIEEMAERYEVPPDQVKKEIFSNIENSYKSFPNSQSEDIDGADYEGKKYTYSGKATGSSMFNGGGDLEYQNREYVLELPNVNDKTGSMPSASEFNAAGFSAPEARLTVTFPGEVTEAPTGEIEGKKASWNLFDPGVEVSAKAKGDVFPPWAWIVIVVGGVLLLTAVVALILVLVGRRKRRQQVAVAGEYAAHYPPEAPSQMAPGQVAPGYVSPGPSAAGPSAAGQVPPGEGAPGYEVSTPPPPVQYSAAQQGESPLPPLQNTTENQEFAPPPQQPEESQVSPQLPEAEQPPEAGPSSGPEQSSGGEELPPPPQ